MTKYYTGVGSTQTPLPVQQQMVAMAGRLEDEGFILRSGGAIGADSAFESGVLVPSDKEIYIPWKKFENRTSDSHVSNDIVIGTNSVAADIARNVIPHWPKLGYAGKLLHTRNIFQVLGKDLKTPSKFVICWTANGRDNGGTRTVIVLARENNIPVYNIGLKTLEHIAPFKLVDKILSEIKIT